MNAVRNRLGLHETDDRHDSGLSLIEVVVAMLIFAMISTGAIFTMVSVLSLTRDNRSTQVAANLAAQEIDLARDYADLFDLVDRVSDPIEVNDDLFHVSRTTQWVVAPSTSDGCGGSGSGGAALRYKRVNVSVTWDNMRPSTEPVRSSTLIDPKNRINDPALGTILVSVEDSAGTGEPGVLVDADPHATTPAGAQPLTVPPKPTDAQGCTYLLKLHPGNYTVTVEKPGLAVEGENAVTTQTVSVAAGTSSSLGFAVDEASQLEIRFASNYTAPRMLDLPLNLDATFFGQGKIWVSEGTGTAARQRTVQVQAVDTGYWVIAGRYSPAASDPKLGCLSPDPVEWKPNRVSGIDYSAIRPPATVAKPGGSAIANVPMGIVTIKHEGDKYLKAVSASPVLPADPGCKAVLSYSFGKVLEKRDGFTTIALPYGSWNLFTGGKDKQDSLLKVGVKVDSGGWPNCDGTVLLDPRPLVPTGPDCGGDDDGGDDDD